MMRHFIRPRYLRDIDSANKSAEVFSLAFSHTDSEPTYTEKWLQDLIHENPSLLPVEAFEPSFENIKAIARELPTPAGLLDNLFATPDGDLILIECKLWRNPEARRKVIAQIIDYAAAISEWDYEDLSHAINATREKSTQNPLYDCFQGHPDVLEEIPFIDNVTKNLRLGRYLLLVVGDGIREDMERISDFLQQKMGLHFTLGLLELGIYKIPDQDSLLVIPNVMLKTTMIDRGVIRVENGKARLDETALNTEEKSSVRSYKRSENLTEIKFFEVLSAADGASALWLWNRLDDMQGLGMTWDIKQSLLPRYSPDGETQFNFGYFRTDGRFFTHNAKWHLEEKNMKHLGEAYIENIAQLVEGARIQKSSDKDWKVFVGDRPLNISDLIGKEKEFMKVVSDYISVIQTTFEKDD